MAGNEVVLNIGGDAQQLRQAASQAEQALSSVESAVAETNQAMDAAGQQSRSFADRLGSLGAGVEGVIGAVEDAGAAFQAMADLQNFSARKADELERKVLDIYQASEDLEQAYGDLQQAQLDLNQSFIDGKQAGLDAEQAQIDIRQAALDATSAQEEYNKAVKEHGKNSAEAQQAAIDLTQAQQDLKQAQLDGEQAAADLEQSYADGEQATRDMRQAQLDAKGAQLDLNEAYRNANPSGLQQVADTVNMLTPLMTGLISIVALATAAQWLWNIAMAANPIGLVIVAIVAVIAGIVLLATQVEWFGDFWVGVWNFIVSAFKLWWSAFSGMWIAIGSFFVNLFVGWWKLFTGFWTGVWDLGVKVVEWFKTVPSLLKSAFSSLFSILTAPFRTAFNFIADAWNNTIGQLRWTAPDWVPGIGGKSVGAPRLPKFHDGGVVPGAPGSELLAVLQAGERVTPIGGRAADERTVIEIRSDGTQIGDALVELLSGAIRRNGGLDVALGGRSV